MAGGLAALEGHPFYVYKPPFLPLHVRHAGIGPRELPSIFVAQLIQSCGQDHLESEIRFEIKTLNDGAWFWYPLSFRQTSPAFHHEGAGVIEEGHFWHDEAIESGMNVIAKTWDEILISRGYLEIKTVL